MLAYGPMAIYGQNGHLWSSGHRTTDYTCNGFRHSGPSLWLNHKHSSSQEPVMSVIFINSINFCNISLGQQQNINIDLTRIVNCGPSIDNAVRLSPIVLVDGWEVKVVDKLVLDAVGELRGDHHTSFGVDSVSGELLVVGGRDNSNEKYFQI